MAYKDLNKKREANRRWAKNNSEKARESIKRWGLNNVEKRRKTSRERARQRRLIDPEGENAKQRQWRHNNIEAVREAERRRKLKSCYGLSLDDFNNLFQQQNGLCAICEEAEADCIDHNHTTGIVRALLCSHCNIGIGQLREDERILLNAIKYLTKHGADIGQPFQIQPKTESSNRSTSITQPDSIQLSLFNNTINIEVHNH